MQVFLNKESFLGGITELQGPCLHPELGLLSCSLCSFTFSPHVYVGFLLDFPPQNIPCRWINRWKMGDELKNTLHVYNIHSVMFAYIICMSYCMFK